MQKSFHLIVHGLVQGVFFRKSTREAAEDLNICGTVRNLFDGSVEIYAEGSERDMKAFIEWCHKGPRGARVEKVDIHEQPLKNFQKFIITH